jgi:ADP-heptose:LPS heptosyltransferase
VKKNWPVEQWLRVGQEFSQQFPQFRLALVTGEAELERGITQALINGWPGPAPLHWDQLPLPNLAARLTGCAGFIGHDSGISHLAAACGVPCLLFFGLTDPETWAPRNPDVRVRLAPSGDLAQLSFAVAWAAIAEFVRDLAHP